MTLDESLYGDQKKKCGPLSFNISAELLVNSSGHIIPLLIVLTVHFPMF